MSYFSVVTNAYTGAWARRRVFVPIYIAVRLLLVALIAPGVAVAVNLAVSLSNQAALTDQDIAMFLLSPAGFYHGSCDAQPVFAGRGVCLFGHGRITAYGRKRSVARGQFRDWGYPVRAFLPCSALRFGWFYGCWVWHCPLSQWQP